MTQLSSAVGSTPLHEQVRSLLMREIDVGTYAEGERLPSEPELCERFGVSRITVRRAVADLEGLGIVRRQQGRGTFVAPRREVIGAMTLGGFADTVVADGVKSRRIMRAETTPADEKRARRLGVPVGDPVFRLVRVFALDGIPLSIDDSRYSLTRFPDFDRHIDHDTSTYQVLRDVYGVEFSEMYREIDVGFTTAQTAEWLARPEHDPLIVVRKRALDRAGEVVHTSRVKVVPSRMTLNMVVRSQG
ncbi:GntR family transcriptional regulator [Microbacterium sp.]|uniref:GntR family transcriptional regulator n=1 Tax=Microbacterium sp. TaxID=51671 RepID=UPI0028B1160C|nr:GntR family transcriptional regulator [Microbacterium sp.]